MGLFHKECYENARCAHMGECVFSCISLCFAIQTGQMQQMERRKRAPSLRWTVFVQRPGGRLLELGDESRRRPLIYCTVHCCRRWIAPLSSIFCFSPPCPWASDASGSGVVECWEDQSGRRLLTRVETHQEVREGFRKKKEGGWVMRKGSKTKKKTQKMSIAPKTALCLVLLYF